MQKYNQLSYLLEQARGPYDAGSEFLNLQKVYDSLKVDCKNKCQTSRDPLCIPKCKVDAAQQALRQGQSQLTRLNRIPDPKMREKQRTKMMGQIERMREREKINRLKLDEERQKKNKGYRQ